jgi:hypothetical protein
MHSSYSQKHTQNITHSLPKWKINHCRPKRKFACLNVYLRLVRRVAPISEKSELRSTWRTAKLNYNQSEH